MILVALPSAEEVSLRELKDRLRELVLTRNLKYQKRRGGLIAQEDILIDKVVSQISRLEPLM